MAYFDKPIKFKNFQASSADYHFRMYKTRDEENMHMIELLDETNLDFIFRLRLTTKEMDKICRENEINPARFDLIRYVQKFISESSEDKWLTCETTTNAEKCYINFYGTEKDFGERRLLKLSLLSVKGEELHQYVLDSAYKYQKRYDNKKRENEEQKKKLEAYERKIRQLEAEVKEKSKLKKDYENSEFLYKRLEADFENQKEEIAELLADNEDLKREFELTENEADELAEERDKLRTEKEELQDKNDKLREEIQELEEEIKSLDNKCKKMKELIKEIADKGRKHEAKIVALSQENEKLMNQLSESKKALKKLSKENLEIVKESSLKENMISNLKKEIETLNFTVETKDKIIEEINGKQKIPVPNENAQPSIKPRSRPWVLGNTTLPKF